MNGRIPPQNIETEQVILGTMMISPKSVPVVLSKIDSEDFYKESHRVIFDAIRKAFNGGHGVDIITVLNVLKNENKNDAAGGPVYLSTLSNIVPQTANIVGYCEAVKEHSRARSLITLAGDIAAKCFEGVKTEELFSEIGNYLAQTSGDNHDNSKTFSEILPTVLERIKARSNGDPEAFGLSTGFCDLDKMIGGLQKTDLIILAGRPSHGKTTLAMNIVCNVAEMGKKVLVFSLEMAKEKLVEKQISAYSQVNAGKLQSGVYDDMAWQSISNATKKLASLPVTIDDTSAAHVQKISARAKAVAFAKGLDFVVVDYLGLARGQSVHREREISEISAGLKALAKDLKIPVLCLSQLSRKCEERPDKRPLMSDLRDSGSIEQDADVVAFIYRDAMYNTGTNNPLKNTAEILVRKNRCGKTGKVYLYFDGDRSKFENMAKEDQPEQ